MTLYTKPPLTFDAQATQLLSRGMVGSHAVIKERLANVNYYRLSAYWHPFRKVDTRTGQLLDDLMPGTAFDTVWDHYVFDQRLKLLVMEAIERVEVAARTQLAYHHAHRWGAMAYYLNGNSLPRLGRRIPSKPNTPPRYLPTHTDFCGRIRNNLGQNHDKPFVRHFKAKYSKSPCLPIWMATELMSIGDVVLMYSGCDFTDQGNVAAHFKVTHLAFHSWLNTLQNVRNICAHHGRLWNRKLVKLPQLPAKATHPDWYAPISFSNDRVFAVLTICTYLLDVISPTRSTWRSRVADLIKKDHPAIPLSAMGFPTGWETMPLWIP